MKTGPALTVVLENAEVTMKKPPATLEALLLELTHADESYIRSRFTLVYWDDENDMVKIENQTDYENALRFAQIQRIERLVVKIIQKAKENHHTSGFSNVLTHSVQMGNYQLAPDVAFESPYDQYGSYGKAYTQNREVEE